MVETTQLIQLLDSKEVATWSRVLFSLARQYGFEQTLFGLVKSRHAKLENAFVCSNYSNGWREYYEANGFVYIDPAVTHCMNSSLPIMWEPRTFSRPDQRELYEQACAYGIRTGVKLPVHGPNGEFGLITFASDARPDAEFERTINHFLPALALIRDYAFASSSRFCNAVPEAAPHLTRRELEVLHWVMAGKSSWEISKITNCSEATVNFHMANVRQKFNVNTRQQAVVKAIALGLITPEDQHR